VIYVLGKIARQPKAVLIAPSFPRRQMSKSRWIGMTTLDISVAEN